MAINDNKMDQIDKLNEDSEVSNNGVTEEKTKTKLDRTALYKKVGVAVGSIVVILVLIILISTITKDTIKHDFDNVMEDEVNSLKYDVPQSWEAKEDVVLPKGKYKQAKAYYRYDKDGNYLCDIEVYYLGDDLKEIDPKDMIDLGEVVQYRTVSTGGEDIEIREYSRYLERGGNEEFEATRLVSLFTQDYSSFLVLIDADSEVYSQEVMDKFFKSIDLNGYKNPRTVTDMSVKYVGRLTEETKISSGDESVEVTLEYDNGDKETPEVWELSREITIQPGRVSKAIVSAHGETCELEVKGKKLAKLDVEYDGSTKKGTSLSGKNTGIKVFAVYDDNSTEEVEGWTIEEPKTLKAGKTAEVKISYGGKKYNLKVKCTDKSFKSIAKKVKRKVMKSKYASNELLTNLTVDYSWEKEENKGYFSIMSNMESSSYYYLLTQDTGSEDALKWEMILLAMSDYCSDLKKEFTKADYDCNVSFFVWAPGDWKGVTAFSVVDDSGIRRNPYAD